MQGAGRNSLGTFNLQPVVALAKLDAGADLVQLYTGFIYAGPALVTQAARALAARGARA